MLTDSSNLSFACMTCTNWPHFPLKDIKKADNIVIFFSFFIIVLPMQVAHGIIMNPEMFLGSYYNKTSISTSL